MIDDDDGVYDGNGVDYGDSVDCNNGVSGNDIVNGDDDEEMANIYTDGDTKEQDTGNDMCYYN